MSIDISFKNTPQMFGTLHIISLCLIAAFIFVYIILIRSQDEERLMRSIFCMGLVMIAGEVFKQWFCYKYVFGGEINLWFFPWQLCSMAMYCSLTVPFLKGKYQEAVLVFLATFSLFSATAALAVPADMMRPQIFLYLHGFIYHGLIIAEAVSAIVILKRRQKDNSRDPRFMPSAVLFLGMAAVSEVINVVSHHILYDIHREPDMFYITPYYPSTQPVCSYVAKQLGIIPEIFIYLAAIIMFSAAIYILIKKI